MKSKLLISVSLFFGIILGVIFSGVFLNISVGEMLVKEIKSPYEFDKTVSVLTSRINNKEGWHVTDVIDQNAEVLSHNAEAIGNYKIIKYCHGEYSSEMLIDDSRKKIGNMMPKTFAVYEKSDGQVFLSTMNGAVMGKLFGGEVERIIEEVSLEIEDILRFVNFKFTLF